MTARESGRERDREREGGGLEREVWPYVLTERDRQTETDWHTETDRQTETFRGRQTEKERFGLIMC